MGEDFIFLLLLSVIVDLSTKSLTKGEEDMYFDVGYAFPLRRTYVRFDNTVKPL